MIELFLLLVIIFAVENCVIVYLFVREYNRLTRYIAEKSGVDTAKVDLSEERDVIYDSIALDDELEAEIEERRRNKFLSSLEED